MVRPAGGVLLPMGRLDGQRDWLEATVLVSHRISNPIPLVFALVDRLVLGRADHQGGVLGDELACHVLGDEPLDIIASRPVTERAASKEVAHEEVGWVAILEHEERELDAV